MRHTIETLFKRRFWVVALGLIAANMWVAALGIGAVLQAIAAPLAVAVPPAHASTTPELADTPNPLVIAELLQQDAAPIPVGGPAAGGQVCTEVHPSGVVESLEIGGVCRQSTLPARLVGTMTDDEGYWSHGLVRDEQRNHTAVTRIGDDVAGAVVVALAAREMWLDMEGTLHCLNAGRAPAPEVPRPEPEQVCVPSDPIDGGESVTESQLVEVAQQRDVRRVGAREFEVTRRFVTEVSNNPAQYQAHVPEYGQATRNGAPAGIRIEALPEVSVFRQLGLRRGDTVMGVNGERVRTVQQLAGLFEALQTAPRVELAIARGGRERTLSYVVAE